MAVSLTVAIPTFFNPRQLKDTLTSLVVNTDFDGRILVINNGGDHYTEVAGSVPYDIDWVEAGSNLGWIGGINAALDMSDTEYFCMMNDDVLFPPESKHFWKHTLKWFHLSGTGGVGPSSNYVSGLQSAFAYRREPCWYVPFLIGFCATYRTGMLRGLGGLDPALPGGDDLDLSMRVADLGYTLIADRRLYLHHHGGQTGKRVYSDYWDSTAHRAETDNALIRKHGLRRWWKLMNAEAQAISFIGREPRSALVDLARASRQEEAGTIEDRYYQALLSPSDIDEHLITLNRFAMGCREITEFGSNDGTSSLAFLNAKPERFISYDIVRKPEIDALEAQAAAEGITFEFKRLDTVSEEAQASFRDTDLLFIDDLHRGDHLARELELYGNRARKYLAFHDVSLFGAVGEGTKGDVVTPGLWPAIGAFLRENKQWRIIHTTERQNGLLILGRLV